MQDGVSAIKVLAVVMVVTVVLLLAFRDQQPLEAQKAFTTITVEYKMSKTAPGEKAQHDYLIFSPGELLENKDDPTIGKANSDAIYDRLQTGHSYLVEVRGICDPDHSWFRNIVRIVAERGGTKET